MRAYSFALTLAQLKQAIEQAQRDKAAKRQSNSESWKPRFFDGDYADGRPRLTDEGRSAVAADLAGKGYPEA